MDMDRTDRAAGLASRGAIRELRRVDAAAFASETGAEQAIFASMHPGAFPVVWRLATGARMAAAAGASTLAAILRTDAAAAGADAATLAIADGSAPTDDALGAALAHADLVTRRPHAAGPADILRLQTAGFSDADIVALSELIAFVSYQARCAVGLALVSETSA